MDGKKMNFLIICWMPTTEMVYTFDCTKEDGKIFDSNDNSNYLTVGARKLCWEDF